MRVGVVSSLWRYPVKSMLGERCDRLEIEAAGIVGDRRFAVRGLREQDKLLPFRMQGEEMLFPDGRRMSADLVEAGRPQVDAAPVHLLTTASLRWLQGRLPGSRIDERRFRPNIVIDAPGDAPVEQAWLGRTLAIGDAVRLRVVEPTQRCVMTTFAQAELPADPAVLRTIGREAALRFGVYAEVLAGGAVARGDVVH